MSKPSLITNLLGRRVRFAEEVKTWPHPVHSRRAAQGEAGEIVAVRTVDNALVLTVRWADGVAGDFNLSHLLIERA